MAMRIFAPVILSLGLFFFGVLPAWALELYQGEVTIQKQQATEKGLKKALGQVLIKVSGNPQVLTVPTIQQALKQVKRYVNNYRVVGDGAGYKLYAYFDRESVNQLLSQNGQALWVNDRPSIITWVAIKDLDNGSLDTGNDNPSFVQTLKKASRSHGLTTRVPMWDLQDLKHIQPIHIWKFDLQTIKQVSQRYQSEDNPILIGALSFQDDIWQARWLFIDNDGMEWRWSMQNQTLEAVINTTFDHVLSNMAERHGVLHSANLKQTLTLRVYGARGFHDLEKIQYELRHQPLVDEVEVQQITSTQITLDVKATGDEEALLSELTRSNKIDHGKIEPDTRVLIIQWRRNHHG